MKKIKVLLVNDYLERGGIETLILDFISVSKKGDELIDISILLKNKKGNLTQYISNDTHLYVIDRKRKLDIHYLLLLRKFIKKNSFNLIHTHTPISGSYILCAR